MRHIDAEKLIAALERQNADKKIIQPLIHIIDSLQQEQLPGIEENGIPGKDFIPVEWVDACEKYGKWKIVKQEQPEVDLEKEVRPIWENKKNRPVSFKEFVSIARYFYELSRLNARKEE